jgi:hypothetical protein
VIYSLIALAALIIIARIYLRLVIQKQELVAADWLRIAAWCSAFTTASFDIVFLKEDVLDPSLNYTLVNWDAPPEKLERVLKVSLTVKTAYGLKLMRYCSICGLVSFPSSRRSTCAKHLFLSSTSNYFRLS